MSNAIIKVEGLGKKYIISHERREGYTALRDVISNKVKGLTRKSTIEKEEFWALKDVNFEINAGDAVGIIGRNGAGKSTLLKVLSRITEPTHGRIELNGRVASLLEVGTGFHPELTGRENVFLNGAILGMSRTEIKRKFDEIIDFSGVEKFLDTPVKRYSSGMYVRLAFAVAAHLEPEILVVDEVLAVGDAEFQKKCLGKMNDVSKNEGRTVLFVSHNMGAIAQLCTKGILLNQGQVMAQGNIDYVFDQYVNNKSFIADNPYRKLLEEKHKDAIISKTSILSLDGYNLNLKFKEKTTIEVEVSNISVIAAVAVDIIVLNIFNNRVFTIRQNLDEYVPTNGRLSLFFEIPGSLIMPGNYNLNVVLHIPNVRVIDQIKDTMNFEVVDQGSEFSKNNGIHVGDIYMSTMVKVVKG